MPGFASLILHWHRSSCFLCRLEGCSQRHFSSKAGWNVEAILNLEAVERLGRPFNALYIPLPTACASGGGKAFPICLYAAVFPPLNIHESGNACSRAVIESVRRGLPSMGKSASGGSFAMPSPSTPSDFHCFFARVGPKSGPPCFF